MIFIHYYMLLSIICVKHPLYFSTIASLIHNVRTKRHGKPLLSVHLNWDMVAMGNNVSIVGEMFSCLHRPISQGFFDVASETFVSVTYVFILLFTFWQSGKFKAHSPFRLEIMYLRCSKCYGGLDHYFSWRYYISKYANSCIHWLLYRFKVW